MQDEAEEGGAAAAAEVQEMFAGQSYEPDVPSKRDFLPWHKPRKQWVRAEQWAAEVRSLLESGDGERTVKYLSLPGSDLLDIRFLHHNLSGDHKLYFLGFNADAAKVGAEQLALNTSLDEVKHLDRVDPRSDVVRDDLRTLADNASMGWRQAAEVGPFDIINLDLCDGVFKESSSLNLQLADAIAHLFALQQRKPEPWLLLLTTRVGTPHVANEVSALLDQLLDKNLADCAEFLEQYAAHVCSVGNGSSRLGDCDAASYVHVVGTAICKWLLQLNRNMPTEFELKSCASYLVYAGSDHDDLLSLVVKFTPMIGGVDDSSGIARPSFEAPLDECEQAEVIPGKMASTVQVDDLLRADLDLRMRMIEETATLLEEARYSREDYLAWATSH